MARFPCSTHSGGYDQLEVVRVIRVSPIGERASRPRPPRGRSRVPLAAPRHLRRPRERASGAIGGGR
jgi:hypothetical protein